MAVYAVMERNKTMLDYALSRGPECNINFLRVVCSLIDVWLDCGMYHIVI